MAKMMKWAAVAAVAAAAVWGGWSYLKPRAAGCLYYGNGQARRHQPDGFCNRGDFAVQPGIGRRAGIGAD
uniref:Uncharacterized protein n=1 Tax=Neisseria meningitidis alpha153 TaxID=663926 RepID=C6SFF2_NEIME|nr:hypothetical protein predicted by Glimmer/Critica [Neisseria meningitidis alpha153]